MTRQHLTIIAAVGVLVCCQARGATCIVNNATLAFGTYSPVLATPNLANASITVQCAAIIATSITVPYTLLLSAGSGTVTNRKMAGTGSNLPYNIYTTASYSTVWDNTTGISSSVTLVGLLGTPLLTYGTDTQVAYGRILALQPVPVGSYTDTLTITVSF